MKTQIRNTAKMVMLTTALMASLFLPGTASAIISFTGAGQSSVFNWSYNTGTGLLLTGNGTFTVNSFNGTTLDLGVSLSNTTIVGSGQNATLYSFGFGIDPNASSVTFVDLAAGGMAGATLNTGGNTSIPSLNNVIDICAFGQKNCSGGSVNTGILAGASDSFGLLISGNFLTSTGGLYVAIDPIGFKYQTSNGSFEFTAPGDGLPEPTITLLFGIGILGLSALNRTGAKV